VEKAPVESPYGTPVAEVAFYTGEIVVRVVAVIDGGALRS
jgi:hypothetical protein